MVNTLNTLLSLASVKTEQAGPGASKKQRMMGLGGKNLLQIYRWAS